MKKYAPYIFPAIVVVVMGLLVYRWYANRPAPTADIFSEGVEIENLSQEERAQALSSASDYLSSQLTPTPAAMEDAELKEMAEGTVRYEIDGDRVRFGVIANLPESEEAYQVWLREVAGETTRLAFELEMGKGGYVGSAALSSELLPFEVLITRQTVEPTAENILFTAVIEQNSDITE